MADDSLRRRLEEAALNAWPATHTALVDGWVLHAAGGYTRGANSATPLYPPRRPPRETLAAVEAFYRARGKGKGFFRESKPSLTFP